MDKVHEISLQKHPLNKTPIRVGDRARVSLRVKEGSKERIQIFEGTILKIQGGAASRSFTVRKISSGIGVEKTIPLASPNIADVEILSRARVRRARLFYLRKLKGRAARLNLLSDKGKEEDKKAAAADSSSEAASESKS